MPNLVHNFTTGSTYLPDVGELSYNGCVFSPYFVTTLSGTAVKDNAGRTTKYLELLLTVDGYVTPPSELGSDINPTMVGLAKTLTAQGGKLIYKGRGFDLVINASGSSFRGPVGNSVSTADVAWGPVPELLEFQPLGEGQSAKVQWQVKVRVPVTDPLSLDNNVSLLQFNSETVVNYGENGFTSLSVRGTIEIPLTRRPDQNARGLTKTVDDLRTEIDSRIMTGIDLNRFRVTRRNFLISRDKRTMEWDIQAEELPYMDMPSYCTLARGAYSARPSKTGIGLCNWLCTLRATYTVRNDMPRRVAWFAFLSLLRLRMNSSEDGVVPGLGVDRNPGREALRVLGEINQQVIPTAPDVFRLWSALMRDRRVRFRRAWLVDFSFEEGLYLDSQSISFTAGWRLVTTFSHILLASGLWRKVPEKTAQNNRLWAIRMRDVQGSQSWLPNRLNPAMDIIVDFGA